MCLLIVNPKNVIIPAKRLQIGFKNNPDGAGFAFSKDGQLFIKKGFFSLKEFLSEFNEVHGKYPSIVHFRAATGGGLNAKNCHPWRVNDNVCAAHNGILNDFNHFKNGLSDTGNFVREVLTPMFSEFPNIVEKPYFTQLMNAAIGSNKIALLDNNGVFTILNEDLGFWDKGSWYSNQDYLK